MKTRIESLGVYLPPRVVTTEEVLRGCAEKVRFPLERFTGIRSRRMAGETEFSFDLARQAVADCLAGSRHQPEDIDLVIASNISHCDGPGFLVTIEPATAVRLSQAFGFTRALTFDVLSACTGMFTAIHVADTFIKVGLARRALVVSGEYITMLTLTAQAHLKGFMDPQLACLTLGDAGAAVLLEPAPDDTTGFEELELFTLGRYADFCISRAVETGWAMFTDAVRTTEVAVIPAAMAALEVFQRRGAALAPPDHIVMHQTSRTTLRDATRVIREAFPGLGESINVVDNLAERGNTASTSHFVAVHDEILSGRLRSGDTVAFGISGSGQTVGVALYTFDDLPDRVRLRRARPDAPRPRPTSPPAAGPRAPAAERIRIESVGTVPRDGKLRPTLDLGRLAVEDCLARWGGDRNDLGLVLHTGVYRTDLVAEPAIAALIAGAAGINDVFEARPAGRTLAFDVHNGAVGFLQACFVAVQTIRAGKTGTALIVATEVENPAGETVLDGFAGCAQLGSAVILGRSAPHGPGFGGFVFRTFAEHAAAATGQMVFDGRGPRTTIRHDPRLEEVYLGCVPGVVRELLALEKLEPSQLAAVFPPQTSTAFIARLADALGVDVGRCVDVTEPKRDLFTSSLPYALVEAERRGLTRAGDVGLIVAVGSGLQVGCAVYHF